MSLFTRPWVLWCALAAPGVWWLYGYLAERIFYGQLIQLTGDFSVQLLIATLAVTPLSRLFPDAGLSRWLRARRRNLGVASFAYAAFHTVVYLDRKASLSRIVDEALEWSMLTGWLAMLIFLALALTSNNRAVRSLKRRWQQLHWWVYPAAALTFIHWWLGAFDPTSAYIHLAILLSVLSFRLLPQRRRSNQSR
ncbi:MAG: ferric reductase-like transmembrane domain-containing protein [Pseudomonadota bacterium]